MHKFAVPTPALTLDLDKFERNLDRMAREVRASGRALRPHVKAHKCAEVARRQLALGAAGLCVATVPEAEAMAREGFTGLLLTGPLGDPAKVGRVVATGAMAAVDHLRQAEWYAAAAQAANRTVDLLIDLDIGDHRTGVSSTEQALDSYGRNLGIAFQLVDDAIDYASDVETMGKGVGDDFRDGKVTLPVILANARGSDADKAFWRAAMEGRKVSDEDLAHATQLLRDTRALDDTLMRARHYGQRAIDALGPFAGSAAKSALVEAVEFAIARAY